MEHICCEKDEMMKNYLSKLYISTARDLQRISLVGSVAVLMLALLGASMTTSVFAAPSLKSSSCTEFGQNQLRCTADVSGLGGATTATGTLTAQANIVTGCVNKGGNEPQGYYYYSN
jgi:hypothetical protein